jgi:hypothetical protein
LLLVEVVALTTVVVEVLVVFSQEQVILSHQEHHIQLQ